MTFRQLLILILYAAVCFGGSFSEITCTSSNADAKFHPDKDDQNK